MDKTRVASQPGVAAFLSVKHPGDHISITVRRGKKDVVLHLTLGTATN
jgi:hypothetical protein